MEAKNYKIYISKEGQICAILLPEEPKEPDYGDCEMDASDYPDMTGEELYKKRMRLWSQEMDNHIEALSKAKQEAVPFKDQEETLNTLLSRGYCIVKGEENIITLNEEGYSVEVGHERFDMRVNDWLKCDPQEADNVRKIATLKKTSPPLPVNSAHSFTEGMDVPKDGVSEKGVINLEMLKRVCYHFAGQVAVGYDYNPGRTFEFVWKHWLEDGKIYEWSYHPSTSKEIVKLSDLINKDSRLRQLREDGMRDFLQTKIDKIDALCKQLDERDQVFKDIIKGFEIKISELEARESDYQKGVKDGYQSGLNFIKMKLTPIG